MAPVRLAKKPEKKSFDEKLEDALLQYAHILVPLFIIIGVIVIAILIFTFVNASPVSTGTEANNYYYHLKDVI